AGGVPPLPGIPGRQEEGVRSRNAGRAALLQLTVRRRHLLLVGFGLGALTVIAITAIVNRGALLTPTNTAGNTAALSSPVLRPSPKLTQSPAGPGPRAGAACARTTRGRAGRPGPSR